MQITEAEAKTKWCHRTDGDKCCASDCMAWRTYGMAGEIFRLEESAAHALLFRYPTAYELLDAGPGGMRAVKRLADVGYCGLAGQP